MKQYEYKVEFIQIGLKDMFKSSKDTLDKRVNEKLNELGKDGWELTGVSGNWFYFKRDIS